MGDKVKWSNSAVNTLRECNRKYYFAHIMATHGRKNPLRRKAYELKSMQNLTMWKGSVLDKFMETILIPMIRDKQPLDFASLADQALELAKRQFNYSKQEVYTDACVSKTDAGADFCILDIHALGKEYTESEIFEAYGMIHSIVLNIPFIKMPDRQLLVDYLKKADALTPNVNNWIVHVEDAQVKPQIDLIVYQNWKPVIMDWKLSSSFTSDYSNQLLVCGLTVYLKRLEKKDKLPYEYSEIKLFEVNLLQGTVIEHEFTEDRINRIIDDINLTSRDILLLTNGEEYHDIDIEDFELTDDENSCLFCNFRLLCSYLQINNNVYDEKSYNEFIQAKQYC